MPRQWIEIVRPWGPLAENRPYRCRVRAVGEVSKPPGVHVVLEHLDEPQGGRTHAVVLPLPLRPEGLGARFFRACGLDFTVGRRITPKETVGKTVSVQFASSPGAGLQVTSFDPATGASESITEEITHGESAP